MRRLIEHKTINWILEIWNISIIKLILVFKCNLHSIFQFDSHAILHLLFVKFKMISLIKCNLKYSINFFDGFVIILWCHLSLIWCMSWLNKMQLIETRIYLFIYRLSRESKLYLWLNPNSPKFVMRLRWIETLLQVMRRIFCQFKLKIKLKNFEPVQSI